MGFSLDGVGLTHANGFRALRGVDLRVAAGERVALIGASGAGKTTLLRVLAASLRPSEGRVRLLGGEPWVDSPRALRRLRSRIGLVHQAPPIPPRQRVVTAVLAGRLGQWPVWKALASLLLPLDPAGAARELARLDMAERLYARCDRLSGGQLQRVALARVLYQQPELLLADEPVSAMDPALSELTVALLNEEALRRGVTLVASLHAVDLALRHFPRVVGVKEGAIAFDLPAAEVTEALLRDLYAAEGSLPLAGEISGVTAAPGLPPLRCA
ncbi:MAG: ATP-binding cassette domain-containing protein [Zoogloea sp.]|nr:ATP-binding cassette domain-containing protein [Zoogloea sp.]